MKFSDIPYTRLVYKDVAAQMADIAAALEAADNAQAAAEVVLRAGLCLDEVQTAGMLAYVRNSLDTTDAFYAAEQDYYDETMPRLTELFHNFDLKLLESPFRKELADRFGEILFTKTEIEARTFNSEIIADLQEENRLVTVYDNLLAGAEISFNGGVYTLAQLSPFHRDPDRGVRRRSMEARASWFASKADELDELYDALLKLRTQMARKLGHDNYIAMGYDRRGRDGYGPKEVQVFRDAIAKSIVPLAATLKAQQAARIGVDRLTLYDDDFQFKSGNAAPEGTPDEIFTRAREIYHRLSAETGRFFESLVGREYIDVLTRKGKRTGGYCTDLPLYKMPFVFANFNGTSDDIDTMTHEVGHAFAYWMAADLPSVLRTPTYEGAEVHSMSMEFLTWPWMEDFFGGGARKYRYAHLAGSLTFLPYGAMVDEFQHIVYAQPGLTPRQRCDAWKELEAKYRPYLDIDLPFYGEGRRWQAQSHIYDLPFYYIDYCLAQTVALGVWALAQKNAGSAWEKYMAFVKLGGADSFTGLLQAANLDNPFQPQTLSTVAAAAAEWLAANPVAG